MHETFRYPDVAGITLDVMLIPYLMAHGVMAALTENDPEKISNMQKTNQRTANETRKEELKMYVAMTIFIN